MIESDWLNARDRFVPGAELFRSDRAFTVWAYTISHSQLLLRTRTPMQDGSRQSRIDIVFKPVRAMKVRIEYDGLVLPGAAPAHHPHPVRRGRRSGRTRPGHLPRVLAVSEAGSAGFGVSGRGEGS